jgi:molybdopterin-guanine dinucleotide biosynthesis protein A
VPEQNDGRLQPLCAFYNTDAARPVVQEIIDRPRVPPPMNEIVKELEPCIVSFAEISHLPASSDLFVNVNTQPDLDHASKIERKLSALK